MCSAQETQITLLSKGRPRGIRTYYKENNQHADCSRVCIKSMQKDRSGGGTCRVAALHRTLKAWAKKTLIVDKCLFNYY